MPAKMWAPGVFLIATGAWVALYSIFAHETSTLQFGGLMLAAAVLQVYLWLAGRRAIRFDYHLYIAAVYAMIGVLLLRFLNKPPLLFVLLIGYALVSVGLVRLIRAFLRPDLPGRGWLLPAGVVTIAVGMMLLLAWPFPALWVVRMYVGVELMAGGLESILLLRTKPRTLGKAPAIVMKPPPWLVRGLVLIGFILTMAAGIYYSFPPLFPRHAELILEEATGAEATVGELDAKYIEGVLRFGDIKYSTGEDKTENVFTAEEIILRANLIDIIDGNLIGSAAVIQPTLVYNARDVEEKEPSAETEESVEATVEEKLEQLVAFRIDRLDVTDASLRFPDLLPQLDLELTDVEIVARDLTSRPKIRSGRYSTFNISGRTLGGELTGEIRVSRHGASPEVQLQASLEGVKLTDLNPWLVAKHQRRVERGTLNALTEVQIKDGKVEGYVRSFFHKTKIVPWPKTEKPKGLLGKLRSGLKKEAKKLGRGLLTDREGVIAFELPIRGEVGKVHLDKTAAVGSALRNALGRSLEPAFQSDALSGESRN